MMTPTELQSARQREQESRGRLSDLRRRRQSLTADRNRLRLAVGEATDSVTGALRDMENMRADHRCGGEGFIGEYVIKCGLAFRKMWMMGGEEASK